MFYLLAKILVLLILAVILGFIVGWHLVKSVLINKHEKNLSLLEEENNKLKQDLNSCLELQSGKSGLTALNRTKDNLQQIQGIGSILESRLNQLGIYTFAQIAEWDKTDVKNISGKIGPFRGRIEHDNWVIQARNLRSKQL